VVVSSDAGRFVAWGNAYIAGSVSLDEAAAAITGDVDVHRVVSWDGTAEPLAVTYALGLIRNMGVAGLRLVLPVPGDVIGVPGPFSASAIATDAGEGVVTVGEASVPAVMFVPKSPVTDDRSVTMWQSLSVEVTRAPYGLPTLSEADRHLTEALTDSTRALADLDLARGREEFARDLVRLERATEHVNVPASLPARAQRMIATGHRLRGIVELAQRTDGASVSATAAKMRRDALHPLDQAARYALCAAYSAQVESAEIEKLRRGFTA
jgi:hypothetical protein